MDFNAFLKHIGKYKWIIIIVPLITVGITYFTVKNLPKQYSSEAQISTGLVDQSKQVATEQTTDYFKLTQQFSNIIEKLKMKKIMSILSYNLILHDLENPKHPFKKFTPRLDSLSAAQRNEVIALYKDKLLRKSTLGLADNAGKYPLFDFVTQMGYDDYSINKNLNINRTEGSDYINIGYTSENPELSAYLVNTLAQEFIQNYASDVNFNQNNSIALLDSLLKRKEAVMNEKNAALKNFKMNNGVLNLDKQSEIVYAQISQNEESRSQALRSIQANQGAISAIEAKLRGKDPYLASNASGQNKEIVDLKNQLKVANDRYIDGDFKPADKRKMDSLNTVLSAKTDKSSDDNIVDPTASRQGLLTQRAALQVTMDQAKSSISSISNELAQLKAKYNTMVPFDAGIQNYERDADLATKDYMDALNRYNQTRTEQNIGLKLNIAQVGLIGQAEPSKKVIYLALSGIGSFSVSFMAVVCLFFLDNTINKTKQLSNATGLPVIGNLGLVGAGRNSIKNMWNDINSSQYVAYKNLLRAIRLDISKVMDASGNKILGITSLATGEGKSFLSSSLAYAFAMTGKKVLLIGGEEDRIFLADTRELVTENNFELFLIKREIHADDLITVFKKNDDGTSLLEIQSLVNLTAGFEVLRDEFDIIIIDVNSLSDINIAKEWLLFAENTIAVFQAGKALSDKEKELLIHLREQKGFIGWVLNKVNLLDNSK